MQFNRRSALGGAAAVMLAFRAGAARGEVNAAFGTLLKRAFSLHWHGQSHQKTSFTSSGEFVTDIKADFQIDQDWNLLGNWKEAFLLEGKLYTGYSTIWGSCWADATIAGIDITKSRFNSADGLPGDMRWETFKGKLEFFSDPQRPGHIALIGTTYSDADGVPSQVTLVDES